MRNPTILIVTPEITYLPKGMGNLANRMTAKAGGLADVSSSLVAALYNMGADVHVALPHYRRMFHVDVARLISEELRTYLNKLPEDRVHLAEDRIFYHRDTVYSDEQRENVKLSLSFQREVINNIIPTVRPNLVHVNDWMTGLVPAYARRLGIPSLFTLHNIHTQYTTLEEIEDRGIDAEDFWQYLYYAGMPADYRSTRSSNPVDMLTSGIFASHFINTVSPTFLKEIVEGRHDFVPPNARREISNKHLAGCAEGITNAPDPSYDPRSDSSLVQKYDEEGHAAGKRNNKLALQGTLGLEPCADAPLFFWPSRLDPNQKGCDLLAEILPEMVSRWRSEKIQVAFVASGPYFGRLQQVVSAYGLASSVAAHPFREDLSRLGYAAADFVLMPSRFEPCGLPQMIGMKYGAVPIAFDTGGLHDTIEPFSPDYSSGNGILFEVHDAQGLLWAVSEAMRFYLQPPRLRAATVARIMKQAMARFNLERTASRYVALYEKMLARPLVKRTNASKRKRKPF
ncbi:MAG: glycogen synthase [Deltaproteobacteria bacterium]|nr:MAG: glycogen synthase [Deltaproteobacteria bacterium]